MIAAAIRRGLACVALTSASCTFLYDPAQFRTTDASSGTHDAGLDAFVPPELDAALDAWSLDAPATDSSATDTASLDANAPDASLPCPLPPRSLELPTCASTAALYYCVPGVSDDVAMFSAVNAMAVQPLTVGHRLGVLGNGIDVASAPSGAIVDHEITRTDSDLVVHVLGRDALEGTSEAPVLARRLYQVAEARLMEQSLAVYETDLLEVGDVSVAPERVDAVTVLTTGTDDRWVSQSCASPTTCVTTPLPIQPARGESPFVANADGAVIAAFSLSSSRLQVQRLQPGPNVEADVPSPRITSLRSTSGRLVYTDGAMADEQSAFVVGEEATAIAHLPIGTGRPRIAQLDEDHFALVRVREMGSLAFITRLEIDCTSGTCACVGGCESSGAEEASVVLRTGGLRDWTFHQVGDVRIAVLLSGDSGGTDVSVALWSSRVFRPMLAPVVIASGRLDAVMGVGRSVRSVVRVDDSRIEVFASALVDVGTMDMVFLSGLRLEGCSS
ncbi:MAG: hypothetical protein J0L92_06840 [Deltaproteobacteria bacterium]|nr:hypothetical protein [Deltaproteobacteria bacterium]